LPPPHSSSESEILTGSLLVEDSEILDDESGMRDSIDKLLLLTSDRWTVEDQIQTLKRASIDTGLPMMAPRQSSPGFIATIAPPLPTDLGSKSKIAAAAASAAAASASAALAPQALPSIDGGPAATGSRPPPIPGGAPSPQNPAAQARGSKAPPPLPPQAARGSKAPPPLPSNAPPAPVTPSIPDRAVVARPLDLDTPPTPMPSPATRRDPGALSPAVLFELLTARDGALSEADDKVSLARVRLELANAHELLGDEARASAHAESVLKLDPNLAAAHSLLRRRKHSRTALPALVGHLDVEIAATSEPAKIDLLAERARLLEAMGTDRAEVCSAWEKALARSPHHAASLKGLEAELVARSLKGEPEERRAVLELLTAHLARMADGYGSEPELAAWLHVERAEIFERRLGKREAARGALERAVRLDPQVGPVRSAYVTHLAAHADFAALATALEEEATIDGDPVRASQLDFDAARILSARLDDDERAIGLLERVLARGADRHVEIRTLDRLVLLYEASGRFADAARVRQTRLAHLADSTSIVAELCTLARLHEKLGDLDSAIAAIRQARDLAPGDEALVEQLDRLLASAGEEDERLTLWTHEAAAAATPETKAKALLTAARIAEDSLRRPADATRLLRSAWAALPGDAAVFDALAKRIAPAVTPETVAETRAMVDLYVQAASATEDKARKVALLERVALLWEEIIGDGSRATQAYEDVLALEPTRRSAILGLARTAARVGDGRALSRALLEESRQAASETDSIALQVRAAEALAKVDPARALRLAEDVLLRDPHNDGARLLEARLHADAGRWELAVLSYRARIDLTPSDTIAVERWLALAELQDVHLREPREAMASLQAARALAPKHQTPPERLAQLLAATGDWELLGNALEGLAASSTSSDERTRWLAEAAEVAELHARDDELAARLYQRALEASRDDSWVADRLGRVLARRAATSAAELAASQIGIRESGSPPGKSAVGNERTAEVARRLALAEARADDSSESSNTERARFCFELAQLKIESGHELSHATTLLEQVLVFNPAHLPALRGLEGIARRTQAWLPLSRVLSRQGEQFGDARARLGALWNLAALEEWRLPAQTPPTEPPVYWRILEVDATDSAALDAVQRREIPAVRRGEARARHALATALHGLVPRTNDDISRASLLMRLAMLLETALSDSGEAHVQTLTRQALDRYRSALTIDPLSVTAATGVGRLATRLNDASCAFAAASSLANLSNAPRARARHLLEAAEILLGDSIDERLGTVTDRRTRAGFLLDEALESDPDSIPVAARLATLRLEDGDPQPLVDAFKAALSKARKVDSIVMLASEVARVARDDLGDLVTAIDAMRKVRSIAPDSVPSLLTLAELLIAQRSWTDAVDALEAVVAVADADTPPRLTALFALASVYAKVLDQPADAERALRKALELDPESARGMRALIHRLVQRQAAAENEGRADDARAQRQEVADLLDRLAQVERNPEAKSKVLVELAEVRLRLGQTGEAERALVEAVAQCPENARAISRLRALYKGRGAGGAFDAVSHARALHAVIARGQQLGRVDPHWLATLGQLEIEALGRVREGVTHLQRAVQMDSSLYETRYELAAAYAKLNAFEEASRALMAMVIPSPRPLLELADPAPALELFERALSAERRSDEAIVVSELRATTSTLDTGRLEWLRGRRLPAWDAHHTTLDREQLMAHVVPPEGRHVYSAVAAALSGIEAKFLRNDLTDLGLSPRDRIGSRSGHPTRQLLDRLARALGVTEVELIITPAVTRTRVLVQDEPWIAVPRALADLPEPTQAASLARALARIALSVPWLEELPALHVEALLVAGARQVVPSYGAGEIDVLQQKVVAQYEPSVSKHIARRQKRALEDLVPALTARDGAPPAIDAFLGALARAEIRIAYILTGNLLALVDELRLFDPELARGCDVPGRAIEAILEHTYAGDLSRFALSTEATALRRRVGSTWT
jgi:tetratricopeptide (TPR) repeat protein